jgi:hypothetical protein
MLKSCDSTSFCLVVEESVPELGLHRGDIMSLFMMRYPSGCLKPQVSINRRQVAAAAMLDALKLGQLRIHEEHEARRPELEELLEELLPRLPRLQLVKGGAP